jgi:hypothetical protein
MSATFEIQKSLDYGHSWETILKDIDSRENALAELARFREINPKSNRKIRYRIDEIQPIRPDPELAYIDAWISGFTQGREALLCWLNENYVGRAIEGMDPTIARADFFIIHERGLVQFFGRDSDNVYVTYRLQELKNIKFKN